MGIGRLLAMMGPWDNPVYLSRVWCIFEFFTAINNKNVNVEIVVPPRERKKMSNVLFASGRIDALYNALANISVQSARATIEEDRIRIMAILEKSIDDIDEVNNMVAKHLREWLRRAIDVLVQERSDQIKEATSGPIQKIAKTAQSAAQEHSTNQQWLAHSAFCTNVALLFWRNGEYDEASE